ncbi:tyrosine--tRNA ligase [Candidatus Woesearchaeota archaeon CG_4_10_14_0_8_um_filter_47_5]|nr:MAG: tyrosine--tRNA ligase [Candidatus Woesearchaeota archaeon CG_4_10_14_0_8_um_filter_47_5]
MDTEKRLSLIKEVGEEILTEEELRDLLEQKAHPVAYDGFEPSGNVHIAQGLMRAININKMTQAGVRFKMWVADWHAWANNKMGGDLEKIQTVGNYLIEVWKACDLDLSHIEFVWANDAIQDAEYWKKVMQVARSSTVNRIVRCGQIMGRSESDVLQASQILYPCMQAADIFHLEADITQLGMDQRKVNVLARELGPKLGYWKPVVVSHHMLMGLLEPSSETEDKTQRTIDLKMSKSNPDSAIFMTDNREEIVRKLEKAYCPAKLVDENPVIEYLQHIIFERFEDVTVERPEKFGGDVSYSSLDELKEAYASGALHPLDLKKSVAAYIDKLVSPVRKHFETNSKAHALLEEVQSFKVTR